MIWRMERIYIDKLAFIYCKDKKMLMVQGRGNDAWFMPGGKREAGETDVQALTREVKEELAVDVLPDTIAPCGVFEAQAHGKPEGTFVRMICYTAQFTGTFMPSSEIDRLAYFSYAERAKTTPAGILIFDDLHAKGLIE